MGPKWQEVRITWPYGNQQHAWMVRKSLTVQKLNVHWHATGVYVYFALNGSEINLSKKKTNTVPIQSMGGRETNDSLLKVYANVLRVNDEIPYTSAHIKLTDIASHLVRNHLSKKKQTNSSTRINRTVAGLHGTRK